MFYSDFIELLTLNKPNIKLIKNNTYFFKLRAISLFSDEYSDNIKTIWSFYAIFHDDYKKNKKEYNWIIDKMKGLDDFTLEEFTFTIKVPKFKNFDSKLIEYYESNRYDGYIEYIRKRKITSLTIL